MLAFGLPFAHSMSTQRATRSNSPRATFSSRSFALRTGSSIRFLSSFGAPVLAEGYSLGAISTAHTSSSSSHATVRAIPHTHPCGFRVTCRRIGFQHQSDCWFWPLQRRCCTAGTRSSFALRSKVRTSLQSVCVSVYMGVGVDARVHVSAVRSELAPRPSPRPAPYSTACGSRCELPSAIGRAAAGAMALCCDTAHRPSLRLARGGGRCAEPVVAACGVDEAPCCAVCWTYSCLKTRPYHPTTGSAGGPPAATPACLLLRLPRSATALVCR